MKRTVVIVDDAVFLRTMIKNIIAEDDRFMVVGEAADGYEAVEQAKKYLPNVLTMDITMPNMDGMQALKEILKVSPETKVIMISAVHSQASVIDAVLAGAKDFIIKPFDKKRILDVFDKLLA